MITNAKIVSTGMDPEEYHKPQPFPRGDPRFVASSSMLKEFYNCASRWVRGYNPPESDAKDYGKLLDCLLLTPERFDDAFAVQPETYPAPETHAKVKKGEINAGDPLEWNGNATYCAEWKAAQVGKLIVKTKELDEANIAVTALLTDQYVYDLVSCSQKQVYMTATWKDKHTGLEIPLRALADLAPSIDSPWRQNLADLKSTRNASPKTWSRFAWSMGYHVQAALYLDIYNAATGEERDTFLWVVQESYAPYMIGRRMSRQKHIEMGRITYRNALTKYALCLKHRTWPDYDTHSEALDGWTMLDFEPWMELQTVQYEPPVIPDEQPEDESDTINLAADVPT